jgi:DNA-directed RNA polymerase beta subunit
MNANLAPQTAGPGAPAPAAELRPAKVYPPIEAVENDGLTARDMLSYVMAAVDHDGLVGHNLHGYNDLIENGINRIMTQLFDIDRMLRNERTQTAEDRKRKSFQVRFQFHDVKVGRPTCTTYLTGQFTDLYPGRARLTGLPYSGPVTLGATVMVRAFYEDGRAEDRAVEIPPFKIGDFPTMVGGVNCHTASCPRAGLKEMGEDPTDPGGYFIAKRNEYVVDLLENICYNKPHNHVGMKANEHVRAEFLSQPGGAFENSSQIRARCMTNGQITVEINSTKFEKVRLPFFLIYRLFGMTDDRAIVETVVFDADDKGPITARMLDILERAFQLADASFAPLVSEINREKLVQMTAERVAKYLVNPTAYLTNESAVQFLNEDLLGSPTKPGGLDRILLPHMGQTAEARIRKLRFLGLIIHKMLLGHLGVLPPTDRDSYRNKRVHGAGVSLAKAFKTQVNNNVVIPIFRAIKRELKNNPWDSVTDKTLIDTFRNALSTSDLNRSMEQAITSGNKTIVVRRRAAVNRVSSQALERKNGLNTFSALRTVVTQNAGNASKATERADMMRRVHPTYTGFLCVAQSADTGENVGMRKQLAVTASVCTAGDALPLKLRLLADPAVTPLDAVSSRDLLRGRPGAAAGTGLSRIFVNGEWIGVCDVAHELVARYRALRREGRVVDPHTTIYWDPVTSEIEFWLDVGRLRRPLLIVDSNVAEYDARLRERHAWARARGGDLAGAPERLEFTQNVRFTPAHVRALVERRLTLADLVRDGVAEYVTPEEQENCLLAESIDTLRRDRHDVTMQYSHCDVEQAIFGLAAHVSPFGNHTQPARVTYETNQARQTGGWYVLNFPYRTDKNRFFQFYNEIQLVSTFTHTLVPPNGTNTIIAYMAAGDNQEDSAVVCQAAADRGLFAGAFFRFEIAELEKGEAFCNPDALTTKNLKPNACYEKLADGFIRAGSVVRYGDVLIGRVAKLSRGRAGADDRYQFTDRSVVYRLHEPAVVEAVLRPRGANDELFGLVKLRYERPLRTGDKMCLTPDHEVLTAAGWKPIAAVTTADAVACLASGGIEYLAPEAVHAFPHGGELLHVAAAGPRGEPLVDQLVTPEHRMWARVVGDDDYGLWEARLLADFAADYARAAPRGAAPPAGAPPLLAAGAAGRPHAVALWAALVALVAAHGARLEDGGATVAVHRPAPAAVARTLAVAQAGGLAAAFRYPMGFHPGRRDRCFRVRAAWFAPGARPGLAPHWGAFAHGFGGLPAATWALPAAEAAVLLDALGDAPPGAPYALATNSAAFADDLQRLALHAGRSANVEAEGRAAADDDGDGDGDMPRIRCCVFAAGAAPPRVDTPPARVSYLGAVHCLTVPGGVFYVRRRGCPGWTGNSSRSGNKSIVACMLPQSDMPFTESGLTPDMIINTHSFPSRMTIGQLIETSLSKVCARKGVIADGTAFLPVDHLEIARQMVALGFRYNGRERMYSGTTGSYYDAAIFIGPTAEQRLQKFVLDDEQSVAGNGPTDATTGQPLGGKQVQGGLRLGHMECDGICSHGSMLNLFEKTSLDSDGRKMHVCRGCGALAVYNEYHGVYQCRTCGELADIATVDGTKSAILFHEELAAANVHVRLGLRPHEFEARPAAAEPPQK